MVSFRKRFIDNVTYEAASAFDVDGDGITDIVCGEYWYKGPSFKEKYKICNVEPAGEYYDDFSDYCMDVNGDGRLDIITGGWWGKKLRWRENPGNNGPWKVYDIDDTSPIETIRYFDIDGCGTDEIFPNTPAIPAAFYKLVKDAAGKGIGKFEKTVISDVRSGHGLGFADINGDGRADIVLANGWLEQPENGPFSGIWRFHEDWPDFRIAASVPIIGIDITGNGLTDLIIGNGHGYGLYWLEQHLDNGVRTWTTHIIDETCAQYHDMQLVDIDNDGELELLTGKRYRAHCGNDPGDNDPVGIYIFKINKGNFVKHTVDYGEAGTASGLGIYFWLHDFNDNGFLDIVAPGKDGLYLFENLGNNLTNE